VIDDDVTGSIEIGWNGPSHPNCLIEYQLEYKRVTNLTSAFVILRKFRTLIPDYPCFFLCIFFCQAIRQSVSLEHFLERNRTRVLADLSPGNYCVQVRAISVEGPGPSSENICFFIKV